MLGSSRGGFDLDKIVDFLESKKVSQLFVIGGDGTHRKYCSEIQHTSPIWLDVSHLKLVSFQHY